VKPDQRRNKSSIEGKTIEKASQKPEGARKKPKKIKMKLNQQKDEMDGRRNHLPGKIFSSSGRQQKSLKQKLINI